MHELLALCLALLLVAGLFFVGLLAAGIGAVFVAIILWSVQSRRDTHSYGASPGAKGVPWQCDVCAERFPNRDAAFEHASSEHPEADARQTVSIASGMRADG